MKKSNRFIVSLLILSVMFFSTACGLNAMELLFGDNIPSSSARHIYSPVSTSSTAKPVPTANQNQGQEEQAVPVVIFDKSQRDPVSISGIKTKSGSIKSLYLGGVSFNSGFIFFDGKLTITDVVRLNSLIAGEKTIIVYEPDNTYFTLTTKLIILTKYLNSANELQNIDLNGYYILANDIDCAELGFIKPIGLGSAGFTGTLDGGGHTIKNVEISYKNIPDSDGTNMGLFGKIGNGGLIKNFALENCTVEGTLVIGTVAGSCEGTIENVLVGNDCKVFANYRVMDTNCFAAGFVGSLGNTGKISSCISLAEVYMDGQRDHEFIRYFAGKIWGTISDSYALNDNTLQKTLINGNASWAGTNTDSVSKGGNAVYVNDRITLETSFLFVYKAYDINMGISNVRGTLIRSGLKTLSELRTASLYNIGFNARYWDIEDGRLPRLRYSD